MIALSILGTAVALALLEHSPRLRFRLAAAASACNLGTVLTLWDRLRGTLVVASPPPDCPFGVPGEVGSYPEGWARQLLEPARRLGAKAPSASVPASEVSPATSVP